MGNIGERKGLIGKREGEKVTMLKICSSRSRTSTTRRGGKAKGKDKKVSHALSESNVLTHKHRHRPKRRITLRKAVTREANSESGNKQSEAPKKISAEWAMELENELKCDRKGKEMCDFGKCWKEVNLDTGEIIHHPVILVTAPSGYLHWYVSWAPVRRFTNNNMCY